MIVSRTRYRNVLETGFEDARDPTTFPCHHLASSDVLLTSCRALLQTLPSSPPITHSRRMRCLSPTNRSTTPPRNIITALVRLQLEQGLSKVSRRVGWRVVRATSKETSKLERSNFRGRHMVTGLIVLGGGKGKGGY